MSCEHNRQKFFAMMASAGTISAEELERAYQAHRRIPASEPERLAAEAKTRLLFAAIAARGLKPPTHAADGLPRAESQPGYAAVYDLLRQHGLPGEPELMQKAKKQPAALPLNDPSLGRDGRDSEGFDRWGYDKEGYDRYNFDREGYDRMGFNRQGFNRHGLDSYGYDREGFNAAGYNKSGYDRQGFSTTGYTAAGFDADGYDMHGCDASGYNRDGLDAQGRDRHGNHLPDWGPDAAGFFPDGYDACGFGPDGYDARGYDHFGFGRDGYNEYGYDRHGCNREGVSRYKTRDDYDSRGYRYEPAKGHRSWRAAVDRLGYDEWGFEAASGCTFTGYDRDARDANGKPRMALNDKGRLVALKYNKMGYDPDGYDRWGYHHLTGLTAPDAQGRRFNHYGWVYDEQTHECVDPQDPARRMPHKFDINHPIHPEYLNGHRTYYKVKHTAWRPPVPPPPITPFAPMSEEAYNRTVTYQGPNYEQRLQPRPNAAERRILAGLPSAGTEQACREGVRLRCPRCGQFTNGMGHACPAFGGNVVTVYRSGLAAQSEALGFILASPHKADFDPQYDNFRGGYDETGRDREGWSRQGYNARGFNREGYTQDGYDLFGYDRDGYDRQGYNNAGLNRKGERREVSLEAVRDLLEDEDQDLLSNDDLARLYSQIATGLVGQPRRVLLKEGGGFATDMKGTIYADPYPLGRNADPRHNLVVTRAGIYHELGHEQFTSQEVWGRVLAVQDGREYAGLGEAGRRLLPRFFNIVEDGRMERQVARNYAGAAEILAASCRLEPRWDERVGPGVPEGEQVFWALLYTSLPYYRLRPEVRQNLSPRARALFDELEPVVARAVRGDPEEAYRASVHIARRFEDEGLIQIPPREQDYSKEMPRGGAGQGGAEGQTGRGTGEGAGEQEQSEGKPRAGAKPEEPGSGRQRGASAQEEQTGPGRGGSGGAEDERKGRRAGSASGDRTGSGKETPAGAQAGQGSGDEKKPDGQQTATSGEQAGGGKGDPSGTQAGQGSGASTGQGDATLSSGVPNDEPDEWLFGNAAVDAAMSAVERDAASAIQGGARARSRANTIGRPLHNPLPAATDSVSQRYRSPDGLPTKVDVQLPRASTPPADLQARRARHRQVAGLMARPLKAIREQAEQRLRRQSSGRLDRRQLVNAYKGMDDVYTGTKELPETAFAASISVDMSGSMGEQIEKRELYDSVLTLGDTFELLEMPYEVRAFGSSSAQVKAMREPFDPQRAAYLALGGLGGTQFAETAGLAHSSLLACQEKNRMLICLSDGELGDHAASARSLREARKNGVVTFGIFLGEHFDAEKLDELYGRGNWAAIRTLGEMPKAVAQRLASIFKSMR